MHKLRSVTVALLVLGAAAPASAHAQLKDEAEDFMRDVVMHIFGPHWTVFANGGASTNGRFMLQAPAVGGERQLRSESGWNVGGGAEVDVLLHIGLRLGYTFSSRDLEFRTDNGDGSENLDIDDLGKLRSHMASVEIMRYMLPLQAAINPYGGLGLQGTWWNLDRNSVLIDKGSGSTQFRWGGIATFGMLFRFTKAFGMRLEASPASVGNPFTGRHSFRAFGGPTIDEPTRVNQTDYRIAFSYTFSPPAKVP